MISTLTSTIGGSIEADTTYDVMGHIATVCNLYIGIGTTSGCTTYYPYDGLSRVLTITNPDGTSKNWSYSGLATTTTDENLNKMISVTDFSGRGTDVYEPTAPNTSPSLHTNYTYNIFGLTGVNQYGLLTRTFGYDSLGRLTSAYNPETGTVVYSFTTGGSLCAGDLSLPCSKTDARSVTTNYSYDNMNRLISKTYSESDGLPDLLYQRD